MLPRFTSADYIIPGAGDVQAWDRYAAMGNNPLKYVDPNGYIPISAIIVIAVVALKVIDYGWTAYDAWQSRRVLADPNASQEAKDAASGKPGAGAQGFAGGELANSDPTCNWMYPPAG